MDSWRGERAEEGESWEERVVGGGGVLGSNAGKMHFSETRGLRGSPHTRGLALPGSPGGTRLQCWASGCGGPARRALGQAAFLPQGPEKKSLVCTAGKGGGLAAAGRGPARGGRCVYVCLRAKPPPSRGDAFPNSAWNPWREAS